MTWSQHSSEVHTLFQVWRYRILSAILRWCHRRHPNWHPPGMVPIAVQERLMGWLRADGAHLVGDWCLNRSGEVSRALHELAEVPETNVQHNDLLFVRISLKEVDGWKFLAVEYDVTAQWRQDRMRTIRSKLPFLDAFRRDEVAVGRITLMPME